MDIELYLLKIQRSATNVIDTIIYKFCNNIKDEGSSNENRTRNALCKHSLDHIDRITESD